MKTRSAAVEERTGAAVDELLREIAQRAAGPPRGLPDGADERAVELSLGGVRYLLVRGDAADEPEPQALSPREREIVRLVTRGLSNKAIAAVLDLSLWTVATHLRRVFTKLQVSSRAELVARALNDGLLARPEPPPRPRAAARRPDDAAEPWRPTPEQVAFLGGCRVAHLGLIDGRDCPQVVPARFVYVDRCLYALIDAALAARGGGGVAAATDPLRYWLRGIATHPEVCVGLDQLGADRRSFASLRFLGLATALADRLEQRRILAGLADRYAADPAASADGLLLRVTPTQLVGWAGLAGDLADGEPRERAPAVSRRS